MDRSCWGCHRSHAVGRLVSGFILLVLGGSFLVTPDRAGWISAGFWLLLLLLPLMGEGRVSRLVAREQYRSARRIATYTRWLHPMDGMMEYPAFLRGLELAQQGNLDEAIKIFQLYQPRATATGRLATILLYRITARWDELVAWVHHHVPEKVVVNDPTVGITYLRSLGETGDLNGLLQGIGRLERKLGKLDISLLRMFVFAFCGQVDLVQKAFNGSLSIYSASIRQFWLATAELAAGNETIARSQLLELRDRADPVQRSAIDWRLTHPLASFDSLTHSSKTILITLRTNITQEAQYSLGSWRRRHKAYATYALIGANGLMFAIQQQLGESENLYTLYRLGALIPETVFMGEWWRVLSANFLHLNLLHLLTNMLGLYVLGRFVETRLGTIKFLIVYFVSGIGAMLMIAVLAVLTGVPDLLCVGASGAVMGLLGAIAAILLRGWQQDKARVARKQLGWILGLVGLQVISDLLIPEASMVGHVSGLILGFLTGYFLATPSSSLK
ncbi:rhomboid family intramembrane serine protease [Kovacikia minuta CCNUW1]|uniref:rhomboid family intramembrane serine protease n=1 Tax=Kovacikia minuta TaxID=2931930 RepID=UPI001CCD074B|nr:rhomboid family intramembrane serine protease [Kovacikia minuta]UBF28013.1 rhomboid family intramembrane serine protease [Kovacikia minuta CCNUW1]